MPISSFPKSNIPFFKGLALVALLAVFAVWLIQFGVNQKKRNAHLREVCTEKVTGIVKTYNESGERGRNAAGEWYDTRRAFPVFEYTVDGRVYSRQSGRYDSQGKRRYKIGQAITVFHVPGDPENAHIMEEGEGGDENARLCIIFGGGLLAFCAFGVIRLVGMAAM